MKSTVALHFAGALMILGFGIYAANSDKIKSMMGKLKAKECQMIEKFKDKLESDCECGTCGCKDSN